MSVIIAYQVTLPPNLSEQRKHGMIKLGEQIRLNTGSALNNEQYADGLSAAMNALINSADPRYRIVYIQNSTSSDLDIINTHPNGPTVHCGLRDPITGVDEPNDLLINVMTDPPDHARQMQAVFPRPDERNGYMYIGDAADDVTALNDTDAWDYLMTFKFLGRCK